MSGKGLEWLRVSSVLVGMPLDPDLWVQISFLLPKVTATVKKAKKETNLLPSL